MLLLSNCNKLKRIIFLNRTFQFTRYGTGVPHIRELKHETFLSTRTSTRSDFARNVTSRVTDVKWQTSKLGFWRLRWKAKTREGKLILFAVTLFFDWFLLFSWVYWTIYSLLPLNYPKKLHLSVVHMMNIPGADAETQSVAKSLEWVIFEK